MRIDRVKLVSELTRQDMTQKNLQNLREYRGHL